MELNTYYGLVACRDSANPTRAKYLYTFEMFLDTKVPADKLEYKKGDLYRVTLFGTNAKQLKNFANYLFAAPELQIETRPIRFPATQMLFSES